MEHFSEDFGGAKLVLLIGSRLLTLLRDDFDHIAFPAHWDLPGGGREGEETPEVCVLRELKEEFGLCMSAADLIWKKRVPSQNHPGGFSYYFGARLPKAAESKISFGDEGQEWRLVQPDWYIAHPMAVPHFRKTVTQATLEMEKV